MANDNCINEATVRCLITLLDLRAVKLDIKTVGDYDCVVIKKGLIPLIFYLPKGEGDYIVRAWCTSLDKVVDEVLKKTWVYPGHSKPKVLYDMAISSYLSNPTYNQLHIIRHLSNNGINNWDLDREINMFANYGHPEIALFV